MIFIFTNRYSELFYFWSELMTFIYDISIWTISAWIFYLFQVYIPDIKKKQIIKQNFKLNWRQAKRNILDKLLSYSTNTSSFDLVEKLCDFHYFREYFAEPHDFEHGQTKWDGVLNGLSIEALNDINIDLKLLVKNIDFLLIHIEINDEELIAFLTRLQSAVHYNQYIRLDYWEEKRLTVFLWEALWAYGFDWERDYDTVEYMLDKI